jgi:hypothetical protein
VSDAGKKTINAPPAPTIGIHYGNVINGIAVANPVLALLAVLGQGVRPLTRHRVRKVRAMVDVQRNLALNMIAPCFQNFLCVIGAIVFKGESLPRLEARPGILD